MKMSKNNVPVKQGNYSSGPSLPMIQTNFQSSPTDLATFERQVDCSRVVDLHSGMQIVIGRLYIDLPCDVLIYWLLNIELSIAFIQSRD
jgi:hypothetical protein